MNKFFDIVISYMLQFYWGISEVLFIIIWIFLIRKYKLSAKSTALSGFGLLVTTMIFNIITLDDIAGKIAEYVWILFAIAFLQEFIHFLKYENK